MEDRRLEDILDKFYLFLEGLIEREPHKKGSIIITVGTIKNKKRV